MSVLFCDLPREPEEMEGHFSLREFAMDRGDAALTSQEEADMRVQYLAGRPFYYQNMIMFSLAMAFLSYAHFSPEEETLRGAPSGRTRAKTIEVVSEYFLGSRKLNHLKS